MSNPFKETLGQILDAAKQRDERAYETWIESLSNAEQGALAAHMCFVILHQLLTELVAEIRRHKRPASLYTVAGYLRVDSGARGVMCTCTLQDNKIVVDFFGASVASTREVFEAPAAFTTATMFGPTQELALRIAKHLV